jgi:hypothetical protein
MNFDREPRFYAWLAFDRGVYYGHGVENDANPANLLYIQSRYAERQGAAAFSINNFTGPCTGYYPKKYMHFRTAGLEQNMSVENYIWPLMRLPELLLYYAEALNEAEDSQAARDKAMEYVDMIRERAGLGKIADAWTAFSSNPTKYQSQTGLRQIIQQERTIELAFEGKCYWELRRWKTATEVLNAPVQGWNMAQRTVDVYYQPVTIFEQTFGLKDYFSPIPDGELQRNTKLVQNLGWN